LKAKDVAFGGIMIAMFVAIGMVFSVDIRVMQTYLEILKTVIAAVCVRFISDKASIVFLIACFFVCLILLPIHTTIIYNVPSLIGGFFIGRMKKRMRFPEFIVFFVVNTVMIFYEFFVYGFFMQTNLFEMYTAGASDIVNGIINVPVSGFLTKIIFIMFILGDSAFSSLVIFNVSKFAIRRFEALQNKI
jgi:uncharacterized membrane protein